MNVVIQDSSLLEVADLSYAFCCNANQVGINVSLFHIILHRVELFTTCIYYQKFAEAAQVGIQSLNKFATVEIETRPLQELDDDFFRKFSVVLLSNCDDVSG